MAFHVTGCGTRERSDKGRKRGLGGSMYKLKRERIERFHDENERA